MIEHVKGNKGGEHIDFNKYSEYGVEVEGENSEEERLLGGQRT